MIKALICGATYFAIVFSIAFALGILRVTIIAPAIGPYAAVLIEVPVLVCVSWFAATRLLGHQRFDARQRLTMGGFAFGLLMITECLLAIILFHQSAADWVLALMTPLGLIGLAGQLMFGFVPLLVRRSTA